MDIAPSRIRILLALLPLAAAAPTAVAGEPNAAAAPGAGVPFPEAPVHGGAASDEAPGDRAPNPPGTVIDAEASASEPSRSLPPDTPFRDEIASLSRHPSETVRRACERMQQGQGTLTQVWQVEARWLTAELNREPGAAEHRALLERLLINLRHRQMLLLASSHYDPEDRTLAELTAERKAAEAALAALAKDEDRCPDTPDCAEAPPSDATGDAAVPAEPAETSIPPPPAAPPLRDSCGTTSRGELPAASAVCKPRPAAPSLPEPAKASAFSPLRTSSPPVG